MSRGVMACLAHRCRALAGRGSGAIRGGKTPAALACGVLAAAALLARTADARDLGEIEHHLDVALERIAGTARGQVPRVGWEALWAAAVAHSPARLREECDPDDEPADCAREAADLARKARRVLERRPAFEVAGTVRLGEWDPRSRTFAAVFEPAVDRSDRETVLACRRALAGRRSGIWSGGRCLLAARPVARRVDVAPAEQGGPPRYLSHTLLDAPPVTLRSPPVGAGAARDIAAAGDGGGFPARLVVRPVRAAVSCEPMPVAFEIAFDDTRHSVERDYDACWTAVGVSGQEIGWPSAFREDGP